MINFDCREILHVWDDADTDSYKRIKRQNENRIRHMSDSQKSNNLLFDRLEHYQNKLLDLKRSNRCVCLTQLRKTHSFDMTRLAEEHEERIQDATRQAFLRKKPVCILPGLQKSMRRGSRMPPGRRS